MVIVVVMGVVVIVKVVVGVVVVVVIIAETKRNTRCARTIDMQEQCAYLYKSCVNIHCSSLELLRVT